MNEAPDHGADQTLSHLGDGLAAHVTVPPVTCVLRRATPLHRALFRLEDMAAEISVPPVPHAIRLATPRRRAVVAGCSICALGVVGAALILVPGASNGSIGPSELWAQHVGGSDSTSQPGESPLTMPSFPNDLVAQATNQQPAAPPVAAKPVAAKLAAAPPAAKAAVAKPVAAKPAAAKSAAAARQVPTQSRTPPPTTQRQLTTSTTLTVTPLSPATVVGTTAGDVGVMLTATVSPWLAAGSVQFKDGTNIINVATVVDGKASTTTQLVPQALPHSLTAVFTPSNTTAFTTSTSLPVPYPVPLTTQTATGTALAAPTASLAAANINGTRKPTVTPPPPPAPQPPVEQAPVEQPPVEQAPVEQAPVEQARRGAASLVEEVPHQASAEQPTVHRGRHR